MPGPYLAEYVATKHYMHSFTEVQISRLVRNQRMHSFADFWTLLHQDFSALQSTSFGKKLVEPPTPYIWDFYLKFIDF